jgi:hypothetical protein
LKDEKASHPEPYISLGIIYKAYGLKIVLKVRLSLIHIRLAARKNIIHIDDNYARAARRLRTFHRVLTFALALHIEDRLIDTLLTATSMIVPPLNFPHKTPQN